MADCSDSSLPNNNNNSNSQISPSVPVAANYHSDDDKALQDSAPMGLSQVMLAEEAAASKVPPTFARLLAVFRDQYGPNTPTATDLACLFVHLMILEQGFVNAGSASCQQYPGVDFHYRRVLIESQKSPMKPFKITDNLFSMSYQLGPFHDVPCKLVATVFDTNQLVLNCHIPKLHRVYSIMVDVSSYVIPLRGFYVFQNMSNFVRRVKSDLCFPMKNDVLRCKKAPPNTLNHLPEEMLNYLRMYLCFADDKSLITCLFGAEVAEGLRRTAARKPPIAEIRWSFSHTTI